MSKWIDDVDSESPIGPAARRTLQLRLEAMWDILPLAADQDLADPEYVHQTRVSSRRAMAAMRAFADLAPQRRWQKMVKWLRRVRRAAGDARNDDVLAARLEQLASDRPQGSAALVLERVRVDREGSQRAIDRIHAHLDRKDFAGRIVNLVDRVHWRRRRPEPSFGEAARPAILSAWKSFLLAADAELDNPDALHGLRIQGKRLRYSMEIFAGAFPPSFRDELYPRVEQLQELLGDVNDHAVAHERLQTWLAEADDPPLVAALEELMEYERTAFARTRQEFLVWWTAPETNRLQGALDPYLRYAD